MTSFMLQASCSGILIMLLALIIGVISKKSIQNSSKMSPFECGFIPKKNSRTPFSIQFFLISLVFLIFDVELIFLFPVLLSEFNASGAILSSFVMFMAILIYGLILEWSQSSLEWLK